MNNGKRFEAKFRESAEAAGYCLRIPDKLVMRGGHLMSEETEADFVVVSGTETFLVECKSTHLASLPFDRVRGHQERSLVEFDAAGPHAHGVLAVEFYERGERYGVGCACYLMPIAEWAAFRAVTSRKSAPRSLFEGRAVACPYVRGLYSLDFGRWAR